MASSALFRPTFTDLRSEIERRVSTGVSGQEITDLVDQFLAAGGRTPAPVIEYDGTVTWLYRDATAHSVAVVGDVIGYDLHTTRMVRLSGSDLFYMTAQLPLNAQLAYAFVVDQEASSDTASQHWLKHSRPDPLNPNIILDSGNLPIASILTMPNAPAWVDVSSDPGTVSDLTMHMVGNSRLGIWCRVWVSLPPQYDTHVHYPTCYFLDGDRYMVAARAAEVAASMALDQQIAPALLVFLEGLSSYSVTQFSEFMAESVIPLIESRYMAYRAPEARIVCGASDAAALCVATVLKYPDLFGGLIAQSPATSLSLPNVHALVGQAVQRNHAMPRCYFDVGRYESNEMIENAQALCSILIEGGATVAYQAFGGDHSFMGWRNSLPHALRFHLGAATLDEI